MLDLYHNPDPLVRLIGEPNETSVIIENAQVKGLVNSGAQISSISDKFAKLLKLPINKLETLLDLEPTGGESIPYEGYVEVRMQVPGIAAFDLDVLMLVIPESEYLKRVSVTLGTLHIAEIIHLITDKELQQVDKCWQRGIILQKIAMKTAQLKENKDVLDKVTGNVKLTCKVTIPPLETVTISGVTNVNAHSKRVNIVTEPREDIEEYTVPSYSYMRPGSEQAEVALLNLYNRPVILKKGTIVVIVKAGNKVLPMLAPKIHQEKDSKEEQIPEKTPARIEKLFNKLDLSGINGWSLSQKQQIKQVFENYHHLFALEDLELGKTNLVKNIIKLDNQQSFREGYRRIPLHQYEEVKQHLKEMIEIGAIRKSQSPWASAVVLVRKKMRE